MWVRNIDTGRWSLQSESLSKSVYDAYKQDLEKTRLYSYYLSGSSYLPINNLSNIYDVLGNKNLQSWYVNNSYTPFYIPVNNPSILTATSSDEYSKFTYEYGLTLKNSFTPNKIINNSIKNYSYVDVATTTEISNIGDVVINLVIDGITLVNGQKVLVKDQKTYISLDISIDPNLYFTSNYYVISNDITSVSYYYYSNTNGIYIYTNNRLIRDSELDNYDSAYRLSLFIKLGNLNAEKQFHLSRLKNGYYPLDTDPSEFVEKHNWILRNRVDYNNIFEENYYDIYRHDIENYVSGSFSYTIPNRTIAIGGFGVIINNQDSFSSTYSLSQIIPNKYKEKLNSISSISGYYFICGDRGTLLKMSKVDLFIEYVNIGEFKNLRSISFLDDLNGIIVGEYNTIYYTYDGGFNWSKIEFPELDAYSYHKVLYYSYNKVYICGNNGTFIDLTNTSGKWVAYKRQIAKQLNPVDQYLLVDDLNDMIKLSYGDLLLIVGNNDNIIFYDINKISGSEFVYAIFTQSHSDIRSVSQHGTSSTVYIAGDNIYTFDYTNFTTAGTVSNVSSFTSSINSTTYANKLFDYDGVELLLAGNFGIVEYNDYISLTYSYLDPTFDDRLHSKLLYMDYDMGSKLSFFDSDHNYIVPNSVTFSYPANSFSVSELSGQKNWISYYKDAEKTFEYYTALDASDQVYFSTTFSNMSYISRSHNTNSFTFSSNDVSNLYSDIINLAPNIGSSTASRFISGSPAISTTLAQLQESKFVYIYKYLIIFKMSYSPSNSGNISNVGDVLYINSDIVQGTFMVNKIYDSYDYVNHIPYRFLYCYSNFNENIINNINSYSGSIYISNLNYYKDETELINNFKVHPLGCGYNLATYSSGPELVLSADFNNKSSYYNMASTVVADSITQSMVYDSGFLSFGFGPTYNLLDYLSDINPVFVGNKIFPAMPTYLSLPGNAGNSFTASNIYIDPVASSNKILFGSGFKFEWETIWINTFVDLILYDVNNSIYEFDRMFIMDKYYDSILDGYYIEFHKKIDIPISSTIKSFDVIGRRTLQQISDDLRMLDNIQRSSQTVSVELLSSFVNLTNELNFKFPTDSYTKILLSDYDIKNNITAIVYTDENSEVSMNVINLDSNLSIGISSTSNYNIGTHSNLLINTIQPHNLKDYEWVNLSFNGGVGSSEYLNPQYFGFQSIKVVSDTSFITTKIFGTPSSVLDSGTVSFFKTDPFFNYSPVSIFDVGIDKNVSISVSIKPENTILNGYQYSIVNLDLTKYCFKLVDGVSLDKISGSYSWILEAEINNAIIGEDKNGIVWYSGDWNFGRWFGGTWNSGTWYGGDWYAGIWNSYNTKYKVVSVDVNSSYVDVTSSTWYGGRWFDGTWNGGRWFDGRRYAGTWSSGNWYNGIWNNGHWISGNFNGGIWINGKWDSGTFNSDIKPSFWISGKFLSGDFENGVWFDGEFGGNSLSRFGINSSNTKLAIWNGGHWLNGEFHSRLKVGQSGSPMVSDIHKYSHWKTGLWSKGSWYGGHADNIDFRGGDWYGGILNDINIDQINITGNRFSIVLNEVYYFNIGDSIWIIDNGSNSYPEIGSDSNPRKYIISNVITDNVLLTTTLIFSYNLSIVDPDIYVINNTGLKIVSHFQNSNWWSGIWNNGIFDSNTFYGGIWYKGVFGSNAKWG